MKQSVPAVSPDAYCASLSGWQRRYVDALRSTVVNAASLREAIKWGHLVYFSNGPVLLIRAEERRVLFGFWRGKRLRGIEPRLKPGGKYEMATLELVEETPLERSTVVELVKAAVALNASHGDPTDSEPTADREFVHSRLIDAPQGRVFRAFADPVHLARWWGPNGFSSTFEVFEFRPDGRWRFVMHGPDGTDYPNESVFREIAAPERIVFEHLSEGHHFFMTITFTARGNQTLVGWRQVFDTAAHRESIATFVVDANEQNLDRLAAEVRNVTNPPESA